MVPPSSGTHETSWGLDESGLVGEKIEEDTRNLVEMLTKGYQTHQQYKKIMVFAIVGVGGIGKTTLAQEIFNNEIIKVEFSKKIWLSVNQKPNETEILSRVITEAGGNHIVTENTKAALERALIQALKGHKILLIMDDVWDHRVWEGVLKTPLVNAITSHGSRVLVTTRHDTIAHGMLARKPYHRINKLENEDAWLLLKKQVVGNGNNDEQQVETLRDIGTEIIAKCDGLPLAVKVMGGILRQRKTLRSGWEHVLKDSICEGYVHGNSWDLEVSGEEYYDQLIARNLIEPDRRYVDQGVCNMHDVVRSLVQYKFINPHEALIAHESEAGLTDKLNSQNVIRLSPQTKEPESNELEWSSLQVHISLRTLILVGKMKINSGDSLSSFLCLRTLHIEDGNFAALSEHLVELKHLRYLSIRRTDTSRLPENIATMKFLQSVNLFGCEHLEKLPSSNGELQQLRYLNLDGTGIGNVPKGFDGLTNLRLLYGFPVHTDVDWCSFEQLGPLNQLMRLAINGLEKVSSSSSAVKARLGEKLRLRYLRTSCTTRCGGEDDDRLQLVAEEEQGQIEKVFDELCPPPCIEHLCIDGCTLVRDPQGG
ncbi:hypothetical protein U9M48_005053 [Paspalum notatum var. saurae]|uniref:NB-ARC domain-containing protein n=1 Tax=Paspalum notatum var. saurae TaxID=547442 RepID=A0AAQ3PRB8_PASNO